MKIRVKRGNDTPPLLRYPPTLKNEGTVKVERSLLPEILESDGEIRFCCPSIDSGDFLLACRYLYYCQNFSIISDQLYDKYEKVALELDPDSPINVPGSDKTEDYAPYIRALALYLSFKYLPRVVRPKVKIRLRKG